MSWKTLLAMGLSLGISAGASATVSVITKVRCEIEFPFDSAQANAVQLEACLQKLKASTQTPDHVAIYASASPPGSADYNFKLSKRRSSEIAKVLQASFPKAEQEFFPGGVNPAYGQKAIVIASISSADPLYLSTQTTESQSWIRLSRVGLRLGTHVLRDNRAEYKALGAAASGRIKAVLGLDWDAGVEWLSLSAEDYYDQQAPSLDLGPVWTWREFSVMPKLQLRSLLNEEGSRALDLGLRLETAYQWQALSLSALVAMSEESKEALLSVGRGF